MLRFIIIIIFGQHLMESFIVLEVFLLSLSAPGYNPLGMRPVVRPVPKRKRRGTGTLVELQGFFVLDLKIFISFKKNLVSIYVSKILLSSSI